MSQTVETIEVAVPVRTAYDQWTQFESFPLFMDGVEQVVQVDDATLVWRARIAGVTKEWRARITEQTPDERIAWSSTEGALNAGVVTFQPLDEHRCLITLQLDVEPTDPLEGGRRRAWPRSTACLGGFAQLQGLHRSASRGDRRVAGRDRRWQRPLSAR